MKSFATDGGTVTAANSWNILNGDCALEGWRDAGMPGHTLVWRENYLSGTIPETDDLEGFARLRAEELHKIAPEYTRDAIFAELRSMQQRLTSFTAEDRVRLWFDYCPFDRSMLCRLLFLFSHQQRLPVLELVFEDTVWDADAFIRYRDSARILSPEALDYGAAEWRNYLHGTAPEQLLSQWNK